MLLHGWTAAAVGLGIVVIAVVVQVKVVGVVLVLLVLLEVVVVEVGEARGDKGCCACGPALAVGVVTTASPSVDATDIVVIVPACVVTLLLWGVGQQKVVLARCVVKLMHVSPCIASTAHTNQ